VGLWWAIKPLRQENYQKLGVNLAGLFSGNLADHLTSKNNIVIKNFQIRMLASQPKLDNLSTEEKYNSRNFRFPDSRIQRFADFAQQKTVGKLPGKFRFGVLDSEIPTAGQWGEISHFREKLRDRGRWQGSVGVLWWVGFSH